jgi:hypothetical protein
MGSNLKEKNIICPQEDGEKPFGVFFFSTAVNPVEYRPVTPGSQTGRDI